MFEISMAALRAYLPPKSTLTSHLPRGRRERRRDQSLHAGLDGYNPGRSCRPAPKPRYSDHMPKHPAPADEVFLAKPRKSIPHAFVLEALAPLTPQTRPLFGCLGVYVGTKIVLALRDKPTATSNNGVWLATTEEHHQSLRREFPHMQSISVLGPGVTGWQILPVDAPDFEEAAIHACELISAGDPRIGKVPRSGNARKPAK